MDNLYSIAQGHSYIHMDIHATISDMLHQRIESH